MPDRRELLLAGLALGTAAAAPAGFGDWRDAAPGEAHLIRPGDLPLPGATPSAANPAEVVRRPVGTVPLAPAGFRVRLFASGLAGPRALRVAPNGDVFVADSRADRIVVLRAPAGAATPAQAAAFANGLDRPYGMAFYPPGPNPEWFYVAETNRVLRYPYRNGALAPAGRAEVIIPRLPSGGHWTRDLAVAPDGQSLFVSVGSATNVATDLPQKTAGEIAAIQRERGIGA